MSSISIIVAFDLQRGIGINNKLPWHLPEDLGHFKKMTSGHPIIMGRNTFESIGRALPNRRNIVVTRNSNWHHDGVETVNSLQQARSLVNEQDAFIIGGAQIYQQSLAFADRLVITEIQEQFACDAFFPPIDFTAWKEIAREDRSSATQNLRYSFVTYEKL
ncbi:dihydrofolate reductase [Undibacterium sp. SXout20W]|uniref:dihydrofolate reductase n=1 Tax=Undibacterium sp. SXout20W TaxID=3413051 RepID=UPI003BF189E7